MLPAHSRAPYRSVAAVTASYSPASAAEFPNDNPALHQGARWVCPATRGPARAVLRPTSASLVASTSTSPSVPARSVASPPAPDLLPAAAVMAPAAVERRYEGPLQLDLGRIVLLNRVENVPPPPEFVLRPFVSSRARSAEGDAQPRPIDPRPCRIVDDREACRRVERGWRVDVAPCLNVGASGESRRQARHRGGVVACPAPPPSEALPLALPFELEAASA